MVFCEDCKWNRLWNSSWENCYLIIGYSHTPQKRKEKVRTGQTNIEKNAMNDCKDYKRKWWKIWRQKGRGETPLKSGGETPL